MMRNRFWLLGIVLLACGPRAHNWQNMSKQELLSLEDNDTAHIYLGKMALDSGDLQEAEREFKRAIEINPENARANYELGVFFHGQKQLDSAEIYYRKALKLSPDMADARLNLGDILVRKKQRDSAKAQWDSVLVFHPNDPELWFEVGFLLERVLDFDGAAEHYRKASQLDSTWTKPKEQLADMFFRLAKADQAIPAIRDFLRLEPNNIKHRVRLGQMLLFKGDTSAAEQEFKTVLEKDSSCVEAHSNLAFIFMEKGYRGPAKKHFEAAARLLRQQGNQEQAQLFEELAQEMSRPHSAGSSSGAVILKPTPPKKQNGTE